MKDALIGHLLSWYTSERSPYKGDDAWYKQRDAILNNRRAFVELGLDSNTLEESFINMNRALRTLELPTIDTLNSPQTAKQFDTPTTSMNRKSDLSRLQSFDIIEPIINKPPKKHLDKVLAPNPQTGKLE